MSGLFIPNKPLSDNPAQNLKPNSPLLTCNTAPVYFLSGQYQVLDRSSVNTEAAYFPSPCLTPYYTTTLSTHFVSTPISCFFSWPEIASVHRVLVFSPTFIIRLAKDCIMNMSVFYVEHLWCVFIIIHILSMFVYAVFVSMDAIFV